MEQFSQNIEKSQIERKKILKSLHELRFEFIEEFPPEILLPDYPNYHLYKCRTNYFNLISLKIIRLQDMGFMMSEEAKQECENFLKFCDTIRETTRFYKQEDIDKANKVLDCLIKELS